MRSFDRGASWAEAFRSGLLLSLVEDQASSARVGVEVAVRSDKPAFRGRHLVDAVDQPAFRAYRWRLAPLGRNTCHPFMAHDKKAWCSQRGVAHVRITRALFAQPGTTLMRPASKAWIPARRKIGVRSRFLLI